MSGIASGRVIKIFATEQVSDKFAKRILWIETQDQYPQFLEFQAAQDRCSLLDKFKIGDMVEINYNLRGRGWTDQLGKKRVFNTLDIWKINNPNEQPKAQHSAQVQPPQDDLPF